MENSNRRVRAAAPVFGDRVSNNYVKGFLHGAKQAGHDPQALLEQAGIPSTTYTNKRASINGEQFQRLLMIVREIMNDQYMGFLRIPGKLAMEMHAGCTAVQSETLGQAIRQTSEFINAVRHDEARELYIDEDSGESTLSFCLTDFNKGVEPHLLYVMRMYWDYRFYSWLVGQQIKLTRVCFSTPESEFSFDYARCFGCEVAFDQPQDSFSFDHDHLVLPIVRSQLA
ncbi:AraC family transcriptional regulator, partial [Pseudomonadales bacterium]|nr:AraC family transcriptional regulator [Pseudomonadales bacterium]